MTHIQRKHLRIASPLVFSLSVFSPFALQSISFEQLLKNAPPYQLSSVQSDMTPFLKNPFTAETESCALSWPASSFTLLSLPDTWMPSSAELFLTNTPVYLSYLDYILLQDKHRSSTIPFSSLLKLVDAELSKHSFMCAIEVALKAPLALMHPMKESILLEDLWGHHPTYLTNLSAIEPPPMLLSSPTDYTPPIQAPSYLTIDKHTSGGTKLIFLEQCTLADPSVNTTQERPFYKQLPSASLEKIQEIPSLLESSYEEFMLEEPLFEESMLIDTPILPYDFNTPDGLPVSPIGDFLPAEPFSLSSILLPLYPAFYPSLRSLRQVASLHQESAITQKSSASQEPPLHSSTLGIATPHVTTSHLFLQEHLSSEGPSFNFQETPLLCESIQPLPILERTTLRKTLSGAVLAVTHALHSLCLSEEEIPHHDVSPSLEPIKAWPFKKSSFIPDGHGTYVAENSHFNASLLAEVPTRYIRNTLFPKHSYVLLPDPYKSDGLMYYVTSHTPAPGNQYDAVHPLVEIFSPKEHLLGAAYLFSLTPADFEPLMGDFSESLTPLHLENIHPISPLSSSYASLEIPRYAQTRDHLLDALSLMEDLQYYAPHLPSLQEERYVTGLIAPQRELSLFIYLADYPFVQEFYHQYPSEISPFLFSYTWPTFSMSNPFFISYDKGIVSTTFALAGAAQLLESLAEKQMIDHHVEQKTQLIASLQPDHEPHPRLSIHSLDFPDPYDLNAAYGSLESSPIFTKNPYFAPLYDFHAPAMESYKHLLPAAESLLCSSLESLHEYYSYSIDAQHDFLNDTLITPYAEHGQSVAYHPLSPSGLNHYFVRIDKNAVIPSQTPTLVPNKGLSPDLVAAQVDLCPSRKHAAALNHSSRNTQENLAQLPTLQDLHTLSLSEDFHVDVQVMQNTKGSGYLFSITLEPNAQKIQTGSPQNFVFLMDHSSSIDKNRLQIFKQAISKSLLYLGENDTFNILSFDAEISKMSHDSVPVSASTKHGARRFLETQKRGYKYVLPNLYKVLLSVHDMVKDSPLPTTVILLTNGKSLENFNTQDEQLARLVSTNHHGFTLFTACASQNNNSLMLEILSNLNRGEFMHSQTNAAFPRKFAALVKHAGFLLAQDIHISAATAQSDLEIEFFPESPSAPNLYGDRPYTIIGKVDKLCDFDLVLQGRFCDHWLNITKKISFSTARHGGHAIYKDYTMHVAYNKYREFLKEGNTACLDEATKVLKPVNSSWTY